MFILKNVIYLIVSQVVLLSSLMITNKFVSLLMFIVNAFVTWGIIKRVEKRYYKKYNHFASMLYNICPLIGVSIILYLLSISLELDSIWYLFKYYLGVFLVGYIFNSIYVLVMTLRR